DYDEYRDGDGDRVAGSAFDVLSGMLKTSIRPTEYSELKLGWIGANDDWSEVSRGVPVSDLEMKQNTYTARYNITDEEKSWLDLKIHASYTNARQDRTYLTPWRFAQFAPATGLPPAIPAGS